MTNTIPPTIQLAYAKIIDVINSCSTIQHITVADRMIDLFLIMYQYKIDTSRKRYTELNNLLLTKLLDLKDENNT